MKNKQLNFNSEIKYFFISIYKNYANAKEFARSEIIYWKMISIDKH